MLTHGILVISIKADSPAHRAGLLERDVLVSFGDRLFAKTDDLHKALTEEQASVRSPLTIARDCSKS